MFFATTNFLSALILSRNISISLAVLSPCAANAGRASVAAKIKRAARSISSEYFLIIFNSVIRLRLASRAYADFLKDHWKRSLPSPAATSSNFSIATRAKPAELSLTYRDEHALGGDVHSWAVSPRSRRREQTVSWVPQGIPGFTIDEGRGEGGADNK